MRGESLALPCPGTHDSSSEPGRGDRGIGRARPGDHRHRPQPGIRPTQPGAYLGETARAGRLELDIGDELSRYDDSGDTGGKQSRRRHAGEKGVHTAMLRRAGNAVN